MNQQNFEFENSNPGFVGTVQQIAYTTTAL